VRKSSTFAFLREREKKCYQEPKKKRKNRLERGPEKLRDERKEKGGPRLSVGEILRPWAFKERVDVSVLPKEDTSNTAAALRRPRGGATNRSGRGMPRLHEFGEGREEPSPCLEREVFRGD